MKRQLFSLLLAATTALASLAIPARPGFVKVVGPDGDTISIQRVGNAFNHNTIDTAGNVMMRRSDGSYVYATLSQAGRMVETSTPMKLADFRALRTKRLRAAARRVPGQIGTFPGTTFPAKGKQKAIVVLVEFQDEKFHLGSHAHDYFTNMLNKDSFSEYGATGSVHKYFIDSSNGQFDCQFDLFGPVTLKHDMAYYGGNDPSTDNDLHPQDMVIEACRALDATVDFSQYDRDNDGVIDNVYVIYAGRGEASDIFGEHPELVWPHSSSVANWGLYFDGKLLATYGCSNEWEDIYQVKNNNIEIVGENPDGIGTFVHEFSHILGLPDLYKTIDEITPTYYTPGEWSVLDYGPYNNNGRTPPAYSTFERNALGWINLTELTAQSGEVTLPELNSSNFGYVITNPTNSGEFFLIESRKRSGWDKYLPADGMLVWHVDYDASTWDNNAVNNTDAHQRVDLVEADGVGQKSRRSAGDVFPGSKNVTSWRPKWWQSGYAGINITDIAATNGTVTFTSSEGSGSGSDKPAGDFLTVDDIIYTTIDDATVTVRGYIVGYVKNSPFETNCAFTANECKVNTNLIMADSKSETNAASAIPVQLPSGSIRKALNLVDHPENLGRYVEIVGKHSTYFTVAGLKNISSYRFIEEEQSSIDNIEEVTPAADVIYDLQGRRVTAPGRPGLYIINGVKTLVK